jgi:hypothetical protein
MIQPADSIDVNAPSKWHPQDFFFINLLVLNRMQNSSFEAPSTIDSSSTCKKFDKLASREPIGAPTLEGIA